MEKHRWTDGEILRLQRACLMDEDCWGYCKVCGDKIEPIEPDAGTSYCENCDKVVKVDGLVSMGLI